MLTIEDAYISGGEGPLHRGLRERRGPATREHMPELDPEEELYFEERNEIARHARARLREVEEK